MEARHLLKTLKDEGWYLGETVGASRQYVHREREGIITVCVRYTDVLGPRTLTRVREPAEAATSSAPAVALEETSSGYSAYSPDLPGCAATGESEAEARERMEAALTFHRQGLGDR
jgi:predicted RNase H-like HicB family nuclease/predicted RNA binding protein YcfA (HicA-like mRNA interferase family)